MLRTDTPIGAWLDQTATDPAGGQLSAQVRRLSDDLVTVIPAGRRSISVARIMGSPVVAGTPLTTAEPRLYRSDYPGFQLPALTITTVPGDDVLVVETWVGTTVPPPPGGDALQFEGSLDRLLLEDGSGVLLLE